MGADLGLRYQLNDWLYFDADANYTYARALMNQMGKTTSSCAQTSRSGGLSSKNGMDFRGLRYRYLKTVLLMKIIQL
jgi:hypothetical protein